MEAGGHVNYRVNEIQEGSSVQVKQRVASDQSPW